MKIATALRVKRSQFIKWVTKSRTSKSSNSSSIVPFIHIKGGNYSDRRIFVLRQLILKFKSQWKKQSHKWQATPKIRYNYDLKSYSQNFDDGCLYDDLPCYVF